MCRHFWRYFKGHVKWTSVSRRWLTWKNEKLILSGNSNSSWTDPCIKSLLISWTILNLIFYNEFHLFDEYPCIALNYSVIFWFIRSFRMKCSAEEKETRKHFPGHLRATHTGKFILHALLSTIRHLAVTPKWYKRLYRAVLSDTSGI